jgi:pilus assembly protein CpaF
MVLMSGIQFPLKAIREQVSSALDLIVHLTRLVDGSRRVSRITEVIGMESDVVTLQDVFLARPVDERAAASGDPGTLLHPLAPSGLQPHFRHKLAAHGVDISDEFFGPERSLSVAAGQWNGR